MVHRKSMGSTGIVATVGMLAVLTSCIPGNGPFAKGRPPSGQANPALRAAPTDRPPVVIGAAKEQPIVVRPPLRKPVAVRAPIHPKAADNLDKAILKDMVVRARTAGPNATKVCDAVIPATPIAMPVSLDYSKDVTFTRVQHPWGGCISYSTLHALDILHDWEHPVTPDLSFGYVLWIQGKATQDYAEKGIPLPDFSQFSHIYGFCSEAAYHTAYDTSTPVLAKKDFDNQFVWTNMAFYYLPEPSPGIQAEAKLYRVLRTDFSVDPPDASGLSPTVMRIKKALLRYGPLLTGGRGHCRCIVGYDDGTQQFKLLNSYGDWNDDHGYQYEPYQTLYSSKDGNGQEVRNLDTVTFLRSYWSKRAPTPSAYSARIRLTHYWRGSISVWVGVDGQAPSGVWTSHGRRADRQHELSSDLTIDVPLPSYAPNFWPPSPTHRWFVEVRDHDRDGQTGQILEFTLARLTHPRTNYSVEPYRTDTYGGPVNVAIQDPTIGLSVPGIKDYWASNWWWPADDNFDYMKPSDTPGITRVYVTGKASVIGNRGVRKQPPPPVELAYDHGVDWKPNECFALPDGAAILKGFTGKWWMGGSPGPKPANPIREPNQAVGIYYLLENQCVNKPDTWKLLTTVTSDSQGNFSATCKPPFPVARTAFAAATTGPDGKVVASSYPLVWTSGFPLLKQYTPTEPWQKLTELLDDPEKAIE